MKEIFIDTISKITYTEEEKTILGNKCVGFIFENEDSKMEGFLASIFERFNGFWGPSWEVHSSQERQKIGSKI